MAGSTSKKIVALRFDREPVQGFINPQTFLQPPGMEVLTTAGSVVTLPYEDVKALCFVRDFDSGPVWRENLAFQSRPKAEGLWVRFHFRDGDTLEGHIPNNLLLIEPAVFSLAPPDVGVLNQRVFVPRAALTRVEILGVVGSPLRRESKRKPTAKEQIGLFE